MHICFLCNEYPPGTHGGIGTFTRMLARALVRSGHRATVVGTYRRRRGTENDEGVRVIRLHYAAVPGARFLLNSRAIARALARVHAELPIDLIEGPENALASLPRSFPIPKLIRMNGGHHFFAVTLGRRPALWRGWHERRSFRNADHICAVSRYVAETTRALLRLGDVPIEILPNPVDTDLFRPRPEIPDEPGLIVFAGTMCEKKGIRQLVEAMPQIVARVPHARLLALGRDSIDPVTGSSFTASLRTSIPPHLQSVISFEGAVDHTRMSEFLTRAEVCVYPSHMEALPLAWLEGMAMQKAVVASSLGPGPEVIEDGLSGLLCDPRQPASIAAALVRVLQDSDLRRDLGEAARRRAVEHFSIARLLDRNIAYYERCLHPCLRPVPVSVT
jgi:glycosyltransferase involved in cell wall biosynthesis